MPAPALLRLLHAIPGSSDAVRRVVDTVGVGDGEAAALVDAARRHGLSALLRHELSTAEVTLPPSLDETLRADAASVVGGNLRLKALLLRALDALQTAGLPPPVLLKGYGLGLRLYPDPLLRASTDVDLLVEEVHLGAAQRALTSMGLQQVKDPGYGEYLEHHHHLSFAGDAGVVELHFRPSFGLGRKLASEPLLARALQAVIEGRAVRYAAPEDELVYLAIHAAQHAFLRLSWLYDLKRLVTLTPAMRWETVVQAAKDSGMAVAVRTALEVAQRAVGLSIPPRVLQRLPGGGVKSLLARRVLDDEELVRARLASRKVPAFLLRTVLCTGVVATVRHAGEGAGRVVRRARAEPR